MHALTHPGCVANGAAFGGLVLMRFPRGERVPWRGHRNSRLPHRDRHAAAARL